MDIRAITSYEHDENSTQTEKASRPIGLLERSKTTLAKVERQLSKVEKKIEKTPIYRARKICRRSLITLGILCTGFGLFFWTATNSKSLSYDGGGTYGPVLFAVGLVLLGVGVTWVTIRYFVKRNKRKAQQRINPNVEALVFENEAYDATAASAEAAKQAAASAPAGKQWHEYDVTVVARDDDVRAQFELEQRRKRLKSARMRRTIHGGADDVTSLSDSSDASTRAVVLPFDLTLSPGCARDSVIKSGSDSCSAVHSSLVTPGCVSFSCSSVSECTSIEVKNSPACALSSSSLRSAIKNHFDLLSN